MACIRFQHQGGVGGSEHALSTYDACYDTGAPFFFLILPLDLGAQEDFSLRQKLIWRKMSYYLLLLFIYFPTIVLVG